MATLTERVTELEERVDDLFLLLCGLVLIAPRPAHEKRLRAVTAAFTRFGEEPSRENRRDLLHVIAAALKEGPPSS